MAHGPKSIFDVPSTQPNKRPQWGLVVSSAAAGRKDMYNWMSPAPVPLDKQKQTAPLKKPPPETWTDVFLELLFKFRTKRSWVAAMLVAGTADVLFSIINLVQMSSDELNYVLVIGAPSRDCWISLCFFTVVGTVLYIPETINTVSILYSLDSDTLVPLHIELIATLLLKHIPLAVIDYSIARSRRHYTTTIETLCATARLFFIGTRLFWYAQIEGKKIQRNEKYEFSHLLILINYLLFSVTVAFPFNSWRFEPTGVVQHYHLETISVYMLRRDKPPEGKFRIDITDMLKEQGWTEGNTTLVHSSWTIYKAYQADGHPVIAYYDCLHRGSERPQECTRHGARYLRFSFVYRPDVRISPWGVISYNFAEICLNESAVNDPTYPSNERAKQSAYYPSCFAANEPLTNDWRVFYFATQRTRKGNETRYIVSEPFWKVQTTTMPMYSSGITVCGKNMRGLCDKVTKNRPLSRQRG